MKAGIALLIFMLAFSVCINAKTETKIQTQTEYVYPICEVTDQYDTEDVTVLVCLMPNGELHRYEITDAPEGKIELAVFRTANQDSYDDYELLTIY